MIATNAPWIPFAEGAPRAVVNVAAADVRRDPAHEAEMLTQALLGATATVVARAEEGRWVRLRFEDGYEGWVRSWLLCPADESGANAWISGAPFVARARYAFVRKAPDAGSEVVAPVTALGRLALVGRAPAGLWCEVRFPDGRTGWISSDAERPYFEPSGSAAEDALRAARGLLGVPYLWGGTTPAAVDCSGLVWLAWRLAGVAVRRDAWMQAGDASPLDLDAARAGDLVFFGEPGGRVSHVGLLESGRRFLHAQGFVRRNSLAPSDAGFHPRLAGLVRGAGRAASPAL